MIRKKELNGGLGVYSVAIMGERPSSRGGEWCLPPSCLCIKDVVCLKIRHDTVLMI